jgi:hypothetical protein
MYVVRLVTLWLVVALKLKTGTKIKKRGLWADNSCVFVNIRAAATAIRSWLTHIVARHTSPKTHFTSQSSNNCHNLNN